MAKDIKPIPLPPEVMTMILANAFEATIWQAKEYFGTHEFCACQEFDAKTVHGMVLLKDKRLCNPLGDLYLISKGVKAEIEWLATTMADQGSLFVVTVCDGTYYAFREEFGGYSGKDVRLRSLAWDQEPEYSI
jgi:hypothetical protein